MRETPTDRRTESDAMEKGRGDRKESLEERWIGELFSVESASGVFKCER